MKISFKPLSVAHFENLLKWLQQPHVKKWWDTDVNYTKEAIQEKYGSYVDGYKKTGSERKPIHAFIIYFDDTPIGYIQYYNAYDFPRDGYQLNNLPTSLAAIDMFIGDEHYLGKGVGSKSLELFLDSHVFTEFDYAFVDPDSSNLAAIKTSENVGFRKMSNVYNKEKLPMLGKKEANWDLYYKFEDIIYKGNDNEVKKILDQFDIYDFLSMPIIFDLISYKKIRLLKLLHNKGIPLIYEEWCGGSALHVACGAGGNLESVKFFIENDILADIHKKSSKYGDTPLTLAISYAHKDIVKYLKNKFDINSISLTDLEVVLERVKGNHRK